MGYYCLTAVLLSALVVNIKLSYKSAKTRDTLLVPLYCLYIPINNTCTAMCNVENTQRNVLQYHLGQFNWLKAHDKLPWPACINISYSFEHTMRPMYTCMHQFKVITGSGIDCFPVRRQTISNSKIDAGFMLTLWGRDKMDTISQTTLSNVFSIKISLKFAPKGRIFQHWFR